MSLAADAKVLWSLLRGQPKHGSHAERLEGFYGPQAAHYDAFRERLLHGRAEMINLLDPPPGAHVIELGAGRHPDADDPVGHKVRAKTEVVPK